MPHSRCDKPIPSYTMAYWLIKSDPEEYSFHDLLRDKKTAWTGVRNFAARNNLRAMSKGDSVLVYHSNSDKAVMGLCSVAKTAYADPTATDGDWSAIDIRAESSLPSPVTLAAMKKTPALANIGLITIGRLSVMPLTDKEYETILAMGT
ncbi:MAG: EVE domain-containing protein [Candidatus Kapaibacterium sp.]